MKLADELKYLQAGGPGSGRRPYGQTLQQAGFYPHVSADIGGERHHFWSRGPIGKNGLPQQMRVHEGSGEWVHTDSDGSELGRGMGETALKQHLTKLINQ